MVIYPETMPSETDVIQGPSLLERLGVFPAFLSLIAIMLGLVALLFHRRRINLAAAHALVGIAL